MLRALRRLDELAVRAKAALGSGARTMPETTVGLIAGCRAERHVHELDDEADDWVQDPAALPGR
eukprot:2439554-Alexandrium_andersonii.AAC.1